MDRWVLTGALSRKRVSMKLVLLIAALTMPGCGVDEVNVSCPEAGCVDTKTPESPTPSPSPVPTPEPTPEVEQPLPKAEPIAPNGSEPKVEPWSFADDPKIVEFNSSLVEKFETYKSWLNRPDEETLQYRIVPVDSNTRDFEKVALMVPLDLGPISENEVDTYGRPIPVNQENVYGRGRTITTLNNPYCQCYTSNQTGWYWWKDDTYTRFEREMDWFYQDDGHIYIVSFYLYVRLPDGTEHKYTNRRY
jgi:hypothetical protein